MHQSIPSDLKHGGAVWVGRDGRMAGQAAGGVSSFVAEAVGGGPGEHDDVEQPHDPRGTARGGEGEASMEQDVRYQVYLQRTA